MEEAEAAIAMMERFVEGEGGAGSALEGVPGPGLRDVATNPSIAAYVSGDATKIMPMLLSSQEVSTRFKADDVDLDQLVQGMKLVPGENLNMLGFKAPTVSRQRKSSTKEKKKKKRVKRKSTATKKSEGGVKRARKSKSTT